MAAPFCIGRARGVNTVEECFRNEAMELGMSSLEGHRHVASTGASIYNVMLSQGKVFRSWQAPSKAFWR